MKHLVGKGFFRLWEDKGTFRAVAIDAESGTVVWPGGIDLAPDALYAQLTGGSDSSGAPRSS